jgi:hypothetical protein
VKEASVQLAAESFVDAKFPTDVTTSPRIIGFCATPQESSRCAGEMFVQS